MNDNQIVELYWERNEAAITESSEKYGGYCTKIANNILDSNEDSEECVNDTWLRSWNAIPPQKPVKLNAFFGKITRTLAIDMYRKKTSDKRGNGQIMICLDEIEECISKEDTFENSLELREMLNAFLMKLPEKHKDIFLLRYWYMEPISDIAFRFGMSDGAVKMLLQRIRKKLRDYIIMEGEIV